MQKDALRSTQKIASSDPDPPPLPVAPTNIQKDALRSTQKTSISTTTSKIVTSNVAPPPPSTKKTSSTPAHGRFAGIGVMAAIEEKALKEKKTRYQSMNCNYK